MSRTKSSRALLSVVLAVLMAFAFMPAMTYSSFAATAKKATKVTKVYHKANKTYKVNKGTAWTLKYKLSPKKLTSSAKKVTWKTSNKSVVSVSVKKGNKASVSFKKAGKAYVTVYTKKNKKAKATWKFNVTTPKAKTALTGVTLEKNGVKVNANTAVAAGDTLSAVVAPAKGTAAYQWYADDAAIDGANSSVFTVTNAQAGKKISVKATGVGDYKDTVSSDSTAAVKANNLKSVSIVKKDLKTNKNVAIVDPDKTYTGETLYADVNPSQIAGAVKYQWYHLNHGKFEGGQEIAGATEASYTLQDSDAYEGIGVKVTSKEVNTNGQLEDNVKNAILGNMNTVVKPGSKNVVAKVALDGKTEEAKAAKLGDTLSAYVTPVKVNNDTNIMYQWYKYTKITNDDDTVTYKWDAISGETKSTYKPDKAGRYAVQIRLTPAALRAGYSLKNENSFDDVYVSAKDFSGVGLYIHDISLKDNEGGGSNTGNAESGTNANTKYDAYNLTVTDPSIVYARDYNIQWKIETKDGKVGTVVKGLGSLEADPAQTVNFAGLNSTSSIITYVTTDHQTHQAKYGDKLYAEITGTNTSLYAGQKAQSNKITLMEGKLETSFKVIGRDNASATLNPDTYSATIENFVGGGKVNITGMNVTWYGTNNKTLATKVLNHINGGKGYNITDAELAELQNSNLQAPTYNTNPYNGNLNEGGKYVIVVITQDGYSGRVAYAAQIGNNSNELFEASSNMNLPTDPDFYFTSTPVAGDSDHVGLILKNTDGYTVSVNYGVGQNPVYDQVVTATSTNKYLIPTTGLAGANKVYVKVKLTKDGRDTTFTGTVVPTKDNIDWDK